MLDLIEFDKPTANIVPVGKAISWRGYDHPELWLDAPDSVAVGWVNNGDGSYTCAGTDAVVIIQNTAPGQLQDQFTYRIAFTVSAYVAGTVGVFLDSILLEAQDALAAAAGDFVFDVVTDVVVTASNQIQIFSSFFNGTIEAISVKRVNL